MATTRVNIGDEYDIYIGRHNDPLIGLFGNPFSHKDDSIAIFKTRSRKQSIEYFSKLLKEGKSFIFTITKDPKQIANLEIKRNRILDNIEKLRNKRLGCFCKNSQKCHGDVYIELLKENKTYSIF